MNIGVLNISHTDLDGVSCTMLIKRKLQYKTDFSYSNVSYDRIAETLEYFYKELQYRNIKYVYITDLNFNKQDLLHLYKLVKKYHYIKFVYLDHHDYSQEVLDIFNKMNKLKNFKCVICTTKCATKITYEFFKINEEKNEDIDLYVKTVNAYDIWLKDNKHFSAGVDLNNYFWSIRRKKFMYDFYRFNLNNPDFKNKAKQIRKDCIKHFKELSEKGLTFAENGIRIIFTDEHIGMFNIIFKEKIIIFGTSYGKVGVRIHSDIEPEVAAKIKSNIIESVQDIDGFISAGGHEYAFGLTFEKYVGQDSSRMFMVLKTAYESAVDAV